MSSSNQAKKKRRRIADSDSESEEEETNAEQTITESAPEPPLVADEEAEETNASQPADEEETNAPELEETNSQIDQNAEETNSTDAAPPPQSPQEQPEEEQPEEEQPEEEQPEEEQPEEEQPEGEQPEGDYEEATNESVPQEDTSDAAASYLEAISSDDPDKEVKESLQTHILEILDSNDLNTTTLKMVKKQLRGRIGKKTVKAFKSYISDTAKALANRANRLRARDEEDQDEEEMAENEAMEVDHADIVDDGDGEVDEHEEDVDGDDNFAPSDSDSGGRRKKKKKKKKKRLRRRRGSDDDSDGSPAPKKRKGRRGKAISTKKKKNIGPTNARTAYVFFLGAVRHEVKSQHPGITFGELNKIIASRWKNMTDEDKVPFLDQQREDKERYQQDMATLQKNDPEAYAEVLESRKRKKTNKTPADGEKVRKQAKIKDEDLHSTDMVTRTLAEIRVAKRKPKTEKSAEELKEMTQFFLKKMERAAKSDRILKREKKLAVEKMRMLKEVESQVIKVGLQEMMLGNGLLRMLNLWLRLPSRKELPNVTLRESIYRILDQLPVDESRLENSRVRDFEFDENGDLVESHESKTIVQVLTELGYLESNKNKNFLRRLLQKWMSPILGKNTDYKLLADVEREREREILKRRRRIPDKPLYPRPKEEIKHTPYPRPNVHDYAIRPTSVDPDVLEEIARESARVPAPDSRRTLKLQLAHSKKIAKKQAFTIDLNGGTIRG